MDRYLSGEEIDPKVLIEDLEKAVARGSFYPVLVASAPQKIGMLELLEVMTEAFPSPAEHPLPSVTTPDGKPVTGLSSDPKGPLLAEVVKTTSDPYVGRISLVRVFSGTLRPDASVHVSGHGRAASGHEDHDDDERIGALTSPLGKQQRPVTQCAAGDICAVAKLSTAETGDTLSDKDNPLLMESWSMPEPLLPVAIVAKSKADEDKLSQALSRLVAEDPTLRLENNAETSQLVLWCMGEAHADVLLDRLAQPLRRRGGDDRPAGAAARDGRGQGAGAGPERQAVRRPRRVRRSATSRSSRCRTRSGVRVRRQDRRRRGAAAVHPLGGEGRPRADGAGRGGRLPDGRHPGHAVRRQGALGRLLRHGLPEGRPGWRCRDAADKAQAHAARAGRRGDACWSPTTTWARSCATCPRAAAGCSAPSRSAWAAPWSRPRSRSSRSPGTPSTCARCRTARARSPAPTCATSRCPSHLASKVAADSKPG